MKLKSIIPILFITILSAIAFTACDAEDEPQYLEANIDTSHNVNMSHNLKMSDNITIQLDSTIMQFSDSIFQDSICQQNSIIGTTPIKNDYRNGIHICSVSYNGITLLYETEADNLFPPSFEEHVDITYNASGLGKTRIYRRSYRELARTQRYCMIRIGIGIQKCLGDIWSDSFTLSLGLTFDGSNRAIIDHWDKIEAE